jgi:hypothetical protein
VFNCAPLLSLSAARFSSAPARPRGTGMMSDAFFASTNSAATVASVGASAPSSPASVATSAVTPEGASLSSGPSEESFGGVNVDATFGQCPFDAGGLDGVRRLDRVVMKIEYNHHARNIFIFGIARDDDADLRGMQFDHRAHRVGATLDELFDQRAVVF